MTSTLEIESLAADADAATNALSVRRTSSTTSTSTKLRKKRESSTTKTAVVLSCVTVLLVLTVAIATHSIKYVRGEYDYDYDGDYVSRTLEDADADGDDNGGNNYSQYTCDDIFDLTEANSANRCSFAKTCNSNQGLFAAFVFCNTWNLNLTTWCSILCPFLTIWLVLLFRMLGSTAEDFFSPSLEMFSMKMGLPPRFAGVTLLALGNGAADVSATVSAIALNPQEGYQMSLGALTGAGMFVGTVVAGIVIVIADGVKCRGALVRDLVMFVLTLVVVWSFFDEGEIGKSAIWTFFALYLTFVIVVLIADIYHRAVVLPRIRKEESVRADGLGGGMGMGAIQEGNEESDRGAGAVAGVGGSEVELATASTSSSGQDAFHTPLNSGLEENFTDEQSSPLRPGRAAAIKKTKGKMRRGLDKFMVAMSNYGPDEGRTNVNQSTSNGWGSTLEVTSNDQDQYLKLHGKTGALRNKPSIEEEVVEEEQGMPEFGPAASYRALMEGVDTMCTNEGSSASGLGTPWGVATVTARDEVREHFDEYINEIWENDENSILDKFFLMVELPFTTLRKLSIPIPCDDYYCRGLVALSLTLSPVWFGVYCLIERNVNLFFLGGFPYIEIITVAGAIVGFFFVKFAPLEDHDLALKVSVPIAFLGFIIAATWIDTIADQLVKLLTFLGVIFRIPGSIMGLTILAWGNSMGDLSANMTMAKKGLANMAITACFAGPVFNILVGLGGGFAKLNSETGEDSTAVQLSPSINVGFGFLAVNCILVLVAGLVFNRGHIPKGYGYVACALYAIYVVTSIALQLLYPENDNDNN
jgi:sodium/potassium/calcium exchanger 6